jgi:hypothetical protein
MFAESEMFDYKDDSEAVHADIYEQIDNIWIVRTRVSNMLKIQCIAKFSDTEPNHFIEFVFTLSEIVDNNIQDVMKPMLKRVMDRNRIELGDYPVQHYLDLIYDNVMSSIPNRMPFWLSEVYRHKFYNHIQRLKYLNMLLPKWVQTPGSIPHPMKLKRKMGRNWETDFLSLFNMVLKDHESGEICKYDYNLAEEITRAHSLTYNENIVSVCTPEIAARLVKELVGNLIKPEMLAIIFIVPFERENNVITKLKLIASYEPVRRMNGGKRHRASKKHRKINTRTRKQRKQKKL